MLENKEDPKKKGGEDPKKKKVERKTVVKEVTPPPMKKDTFGKFEDGIKQKPIKEIKFTAYGEDKSKKKETTIEVKEKISCITYHIYWNSEKEGKIEKNIPKEITKGYEDKYQYIYYDKDNNAHELGCFRYKITTEILRGNVVGKNKIELIDIRQFEGFASQNKEVKAKFLTWNSDSERWYINPDCLGGLIAAMLDLNIDYMGFNGFSNYEGKSTGGSSSHRNGEKGDLRYLSTGRKGERTVLQDSFFDCEMQNKFHDKLYKYGWARLEKMYSEYFTYKGKANYLLNHTKHMRKDGKGGYRHHHHLHLSGFDHSLIKRINEK